MTQNINQLFKRALQFGLVLILAVAVLGSAVGFLVAGSTGLTSALIGAALTLVFVTFTVLSIWLGGQLPLGGFFAVVLGGWLIKLIGFIALVAVLKGAEFINGPVLFFTLVAAIIGSLALDSVLVLKARIPVVD